MSVLSVQMSENHSFAKAPTSCIYLLKDQGVQGDIHCSSKPSSSQRQVHLIDSSLFTDLSTPSSKYPSFLLSPGVLGENITTSNIDLFSLPEGTKIHFTKPTNDQESHAVIRITGLRDPTKRLSEWPEGLLERVKLKDKKGKMMGRRIGVMGAVEVDGYVQPGDVVWMERPKNGKDLGNV